MSVIDPCLRGNVLNQLSLPTFRVMHAAYRFAVQIRPFGGHCPVHRRS